MANADFNESPMLDAIDESPVPDDFVESPMSDIIGKSPVPDEFNESPTSDSLGESPATSFLEESSEQDSSDESSESDDDYDLYPVPDEFDDPSAEEFFDDFPVPSLEVAFGGASIQYQWEAIRVNLKQPNQDHATALAFMRLAEGQKRDIFYETALFMTSFLMMAILEQKANCVSSLGTEWSSAQSYDDFWQSYFQSGGYSQVSPSFIKYDQQGGIFLGEDETTVWSGAERPIEFVQFDRHWVFDGDAAQQGIVRVRRY
ncbi:unnamed protein product, partial [Clonostachys rosea f. rosea IK726]